MEKEADRNSIVTPTGSSLHLASRQPGAATEAYTSDPSTQKKKMRIPIREQLGLLVLFCCLICLAVICAATWITNYNFVTGISSTTLALTASLYSQQLSSGLVLLQTSVLSISTRVLIQNSLMRYNVGNNTEDNWARAQSDLEIALSSQYLLQSRVVGKNGTGSGGPWGLINATGAGILSVDLPWNHANGSAVRLGDEELGFPPSLYPNLTYHAEVYNSTVNVSKAAFKEQYINSSAPLFLGPLMVNESFALCSITVPIINNTSHVEVLGWITVVVNADLFFQFRDTDIGLGNSGVVLLIGPANPTSKLPANIPYNSMAQADQATIEQQRMRYILPPKRNSSRSLRHSDVQYGKEPSTFTMAEFPAVRNAATVKQPLNNNAGSLLDTNNDEGDHVAVGFSLPPSVLVDWIVVIESAYDEVYQPITNLRNVLIACLFGTTGAVLLLLFPVAHYSVRPIRLLRDATKKSVDPYDYSDHSGDHGNVSESPSRASDGLGRATSPDEENLATIAKKEGMMSRLTKWRTGNKKQALDKPRTRDGRFRIPGKVKDRKHFINDELTDLTRTFNEMSEELQMQYARLEERVRERTAELELSKKAAEAANESKTLFIANISHELKTPLNGILGMCAVCLHEDDPTKIKRSLGIIYKSGDLLLNLLTDLLTFSKNQIGQQQLTLDEKEFRLADVSAQILSIFDKQAKEASIKLSVLYEGPNESLETASGTPAHAGYGPYGTGRVKDMYLWGDQHRILQVVINLVSNSLKFTPAGGFVTVRVRCVGEAHVDKPPSSRKGSTNSKSSKGSKVSKILSGRNSKKVRGPSGSESSVKSNSISLDGEGKNPNTALEINPREPKRIMTSVSRERSTSPPPINARVLLFEFEVEDTGPGIPSTQQQKIFEPFVQGDLGLSKKYGGTGLGLSICLQLANLMRGTIALHSLEGQGSTFTMRIPLRFTKERADSTASSQPASARNSMLAISLKDEPHTPQRMGSDSDISVGAGPTSQPDASTTVITGFESPASKPRLVGLRQPFFATSPPLESSHDQLEAMERVAAQASKSGAKVRVLVAEDNKVNQEVVLRMLKLEDIYDVTIAKDGQEAFDMVKESMEQKRLFNLIFMDIQMPNIDGLQSTRLIRQMGYSAPIVALTAFAEESNVQECMESGMDFFLPKPIRRPQLKQVLKRYCATIPEVEEGESPPASKKDVDPLDAHVASKTTRGRKFEGANSTSITESGRGLSSDGISPLS